MADHSGKVLRKLAVTNRAGNASADNCSVFGCGRPAHTAVGGSLEVLICRAHTTFFQRHGSVDQRSYTAAEIQPFRRQALAWIRANETDAFVADAIQRVMALYTPARPPVEPYRLAGPLPADGARTAWEIRHIAGLDPRKVIAARLAVEMAAATNPQPGLTAEFKRVQTAKLIHRMATRTRRAWDRRQGFVGMTVYPHSQGLGLRHIGGVIDDACSLLLDRLQPEMAVDPRLPQHRSARR